MHLGGAYKRESVRFCDRYKYNLRFHYSLHQQRGGGDSQSGKWEGIQGVGVTRGMFKGRTDDHFMLKSELRWNLPSQAAYK